MSAIAEAILRAIPQALHRRSRNLERGARAVAAVLASASLACSGGGGGGGGSQVGQPVVTQVRALEKVQHTDCADGSFATFKELQVSTEGTSATARIGADTLTGTSDAGAVALAGSFSEKGGTREVSSLSLRPEGDAFTGTMAWAFRKGAARCTGTSALEGRAIAGAAAAPEAGQLLKVNLHESTDVMYLLVPAGVSTTIVGVLQTAAGDFYDVLGTHPTATTFSLKARNGVRLELETSGGQLYGTWTNPRTARGGSADAAFLASMAAETHRFVQARSCSAVLGDGVPYLCREAQVGTVLCPDRPGFVASDGACPSADTVGYCRPGATTLGAGLQQPYSDLLYTDSEMLRVRSLALSAVAYKYFDSIRQECKTSFVDLVPRLDVIRSCRRVFQGQLLFCRDRYGEDLTGVRYAEGFDVVSCPMTDSTYQATDTFCPTPDRWRICPGGTFLDGQGRLTIKFDNDIWYRPAFEVPVDAGGHTFAFLTLGSCPANRLYDLQALAQQAQASASGEIDTSWGGISRLEFESDGTVLPPPPPLVW